ncbi:hypothetical protein DFH06DRAFT_2310 [Mycena polygramma]|nr:hypothetical protein DFH06DRAFT_2310 [Mycena polygramma]
MRGDAAHRVACITMAHWRSGARPACAALMRCLAPSSLAVYVFPVGRPFTLSRCYNAAIPTCRDAILSTLGPRVIVRISIVRLAVPRLGMGNRRLLRRQLPPVMGNPRLTATLRLEVVRLTALLRLRCLLGRRAFPLLTPAAKRKREDTAIALSSRNARPPRGLGCSVLNVLLRCPVPAGTKFQVAGELSPAATGTGEISILYRVLSRPATNATTIPPIVGNTSAFPSLLVIHR